MQGGFLFEYGSVGGNNTAVILKPFFPHFLNPFCKIQLSFEGAPFVPRLYTSSRDKPKFADNLKKAVYAIAILQMLIGSLCAYAYGNKLQEIVIMSMEYGIFSTFVRGLYATGMIVNLVM